jgi:hypothetical protein
MKVTHTHMQPGARLVLASVIVLTTLLLIVARPSIASAASNVRLHPNSGGCGINTNIAVAMHTNVSGDSLYINDAAVANNNPSAFILVTPNLSPNGGSGVRNNHPVGVRYDTSKGRWAIFNEDRAAMPLGAAFNVSITKQGCQGVTVKATSANSVGDSVNLPISLADPTTPPTWAVEDSYIATPNWNPNSVGGVYNNHPIGVQFKGSKGPWAIFNLDGKSIPPGASFNVFGGGIWNSSIQTVFSGFWSINGDSTIIDDPTLNGQPSAKLFVTHVFYPNGGSVTTDDHTIGVWYNTYVGRWEIFNEDGAVMPTGASFEYTVL